MHLNKLVMRNFKKFRRAEVEFQDGLTGIMGSNGAGKSTIVEAIAWALYGNRASSIKRDFIRNSHAGEADPVEVKLALSLGKQELIIYRAMKGKSMTPEAFLLLDGQRIAAGTKEVDQRLEEILKISYQDFMKTFYARQKDLDNLLKEGGVGKREYLLKLLGLDDIRESAIVEIKSDRASLEEQKSRLAGALSEIGDVEARLKIASQDIFSARKGLEEAEKSDSLLQEAREKRFLELEVQAEKMRSHGLLAERAMRLQAQDHDLRAAISRDEGRLKEIESSKTLLANLGPELERLAVVLARLEFLEPKRMVHEEISLKMAAAGAGLEGERKALEGNERRFTQLGKDSTLLDELRLREKEHKEVQVLLQSLEELRDRYAEMQARRKEEAVRLEGARSNLANVERTIRGLQAATARYEEILPAREEEKTLKAEQSDLLQQRERRKEMDLLLSQKKAQEDRVVKLNCDAKEVQGALKSLGNLEDREAELRRQDRDLDRLGAELNNVLADLRGGLKVQDLAIQETERSLKKVRSLGAEGLCPTCERPLEGQRDLLMEKYQTSAARAKGEKEKLQAEIAAQMKKVEGVTKSRSSLGQAFDDLNAGKSRRSALQADSRNLEAQIMEAGAESAEIDRKVMALGDVAYDPQRLVDVEAALGRLARLVEELANLTIRLEDLPRRNMERENLQKETKILEERGLQLEGRIQALGYSDSQYLEARKRWESLKPLHDRFITLSERVKEIPALQEKITQQRLELEKMASAMQELERSRQELGFSSQEYESLLNERKSLGRAEEEAHKIRLRLALEPEIQRKLAEARATLADLRRDIDLARGEVAALAYSPEAHEAARQALANLDGDLSALHKDISDKKVHLGVLTAGLDRLREEARRKKGHESKLGEASRRLEVVETARGLVNDFMDQVLIRVKNDIARAASEILEEVSGRYSLLKIDDDFNIQVEDGGNYYPISRYSGGEIDMIAVSVRVAISEYLMRFGPDGESYSFLILDEVFGSQDLEHREKMIQMLRSLEERFPQIIAISHISDVQGQFDNTLQVIEDDLGNSRVEAL